MMNRKHHFAIIGICFAYFLIEAIKIIWFEPDTLSIESDNLFYDAKLVAEGVVPFQELFTRSLIRLYLYAGLISAFGIHVKSFLLITVFVSAIGLYFFSRTVSTILKDNTITIVATIILAILGVRGLQDMFVFIALWLYGLWVNKPKLWYIFVCGGLIGFSVLSYRAYIIWVAVMAMFIAWHLLNTKQSLSLRRIIQSQMWFGIGAGAVILIPLGYFIGLTDWQWMSDIYFANGVMYGYVAALALGMGSTIVLHWLKRDSTKLAWFMLPVIVLFTLAFIITPHPSLADKIGVVHDFARLTLWVIVPTILLGMWGALEVFKKKLTVVRPAIAVIGIVAIYYFIAGAFHLSRGPSETLSSDGRIYFISVLLLLIVTFGLYLRSKKFIAFTLSLPQYLIIFLPAVVIFGASLLYSDWLPTYIYNYSFTLALGGGVMFVQVARAGSVAAKQFLIACGIAFVCVLVIFPHSIKQSKQFNPATEIQTDDAWKVVEYIQDNTAPADRIFTAVPFFALRSGRDLALPITHPVVYIPKADDPKPYDPYNVIPSVDEIREHLKTNKIEYIILDERTRSLFFSNRHPKITKFIRDHYVVVVTYGNIKILQHKSYLTTERKNNSNN